MLHPVFDRTPARSAAKRKRKIGKATREWRRKQSQRRQQTAQELRKRSQRITRLMSEGRLLRHFQLHKLATGTYSEVIQLDAKNRRAYFYRGTCWAHQGKWDEAVSDFTQTIALNPEAEHVCNWRGYCLSAQERWAEAIVDFTRAIMLDQDSTYAFTQRGRCHVAIEQWDEAISDFEMALFIMGQKDDLSATDLQEVRELCAGAHISYGALLAKKGEYDDAIADVSEGIRLFPEYAIGYMGRGMCHQAKRDHQAAIADFDVAIGLAPYNALGYLARAESYEALGEPARAKADRQQATLLS